MRFLGNDNFILYNLICIIMSFPFNIVDVFAEKKFQGNQLAVVHLNGLISDDLMLSITREMNYSETTFIESFDTEKHVYRVRIFTKVGETPFAGHPTLGTAYVIQKTVLNKQIDTLTLSLKAGMIPVKFSYQKNEPDILWMKQLHPTFGEIYSADMFAEFLGIEIRDIDQNYPIQEVSTGFPFFIVPLVNRKALAKSRLNERLFLEFVKDTKAKAPLIFCSEPRNPLNHIACRMFASYFGINEDPATGSANGCLAGYLAKYLYFGSSIVDVRVEQGYEIGRPSLLYLQSEDLGNHVDVYVGGKCVMIAEGELL
jgi:trans-2,3-dihydro-3-hydroxyanthranilate isomerase